MFTGIITDIGEVLEVQHGNISRYSIGTQLDLSDIKIGDSIACAGVCITVVDKGAGQFVFEASAETLMRTTFGKWVRGTHVNLEKALKVGQTLDGYWYTGHIDGVAKIVHRRADGDSIRFQLEILDEFAPFIASKGSIALDGVALTVNEVQGRLFGVNIIPHTRKVTTFGDLQAGDEVNFEVDIIARYVARMLGRSVSFADTPHYTWNPQHG